jgi:ArsR family transcriptional regulator
MNVCLPVLLDEGLQSLLSQHFGAAPMFLIVDTDTGAYRTISNQARQHEHGRCSPLAALAGEKLQAMLVRGIGRNALTKLRAAGIRVYLTGQGTAAAALEELKEGQLQEVDWDSACAHNSEMPPDRCGHHGKEG